MVIIAGIAAAALSFQNCGPTFVTNEQGQVQLSRFDSPFSPLGISDSPSKLRRDFPNTTTQFKAFYRGRNYETDMSLTNNCPATIVNCGNYGVTYRQQ